MGFIVGAVLFFAASALFFFVGSEPDWFFGFFCFFLGAFCVYAKIHDDKFYKNLRKQAEEKQLQHEEEINNSVSNPTCFQNELQNTAKTQKVIDEEKQNKQRAKEAQERIRREIMCAEAQNEAKADIETIMEGIREMAKSGKYSHVGATGIVHYEHPLDPKYIKVTQVNGGPEYLNKILGNVQFNERYTYYFEALSAEADKAGIIIDDVYYLDSENGKLHPPFTIPYNLPFVWAKTPEDIVAEFITYSQGVFRIKCRCIFAMPE